MLFMSIFPSIMKVTGLPALDVVSCVQVILLAAMGGRVSILCARPLANEQRCYIKKDFPKLRHMWLPRAIYHRRPDLPLSEAIFTMGIAFRYDWNQRLQTRREGRNFC